MPQDDDEKLGAETPPSEDDRADFKAYCETLTDAQVQGVFEKETDAGRSIYAGIAHQVLLVRQRERHK